VVVAAASAAYKCVDSGLCRAVKLFMGDSLVRTDTVSAFSDVTLLV